MRRFASLTLSTLLALTPLPGRAAAADSLEVSVLQDGAPGAGVAVVLAIVNQGKVNLGTTDGQGEMSFALDIANLGKAQVEVQVVVEDCPSQDAVYLVGPGGQMPTPEQDRCKRRVVGVFWWGKARRLVVDVAKGTLRVQDGGMSTTTKAVGGTALVVAVVTGITVAGGGSSATNPSAGTPPVNTPGTPPATGGTSVNGDYPGRFTTTLGQIHQDFTRYHTITMLTLSLNGTTLTITGAAPWVPLMGPFDPATGNFNLAGAGTVAGFPGRPITFAGNISGGRVTGTLTINGLPPSPDNQVLSADFRR